MLILQKKYGYAGWFRIKGYPENDYGIYLGSTAIKKIWRSIAAFILRHSARALN